MSSVEEGQPGYTHGSPPNRFLFVSSDGLHQTLKKDVRAHVSRYIRREARSKVVPNLPGTFLWGYEPSTGPAPKPPAKTAKKVETQDDAPAAFAVPSGSSPDSGYDSTSSDILQDGVPGPVEATQDRPGSMQFSNGDRLTRDLCDGGDLDTREVDISNFPPWDRRCNPHSIVIASYAGDSQAMQLVSQHALPQTNSAWSAVDSMPLDPFDTLPLPLNHTDQKVLLSFQVIPGTVYKVPGSRTINNCRDWAFPLIVKTPMLIYAAMAVVAAGREMRLGMQHSPATLAYKSCHIRTLNKWIRNPTKQHSAEVLIGIAALIASEHYRGWSTSLALHVRAFSQILRARGGWPSFNDDPRSGWFLFGQVIMWSQVYVASLLGAEDKFPAFHASVAADIQDILQARDHLLRLLLSWNLWARRQANTSIPDSETQSRYDHFLHEDTLLFKLLCSPDYLESPHVRTAEVERSHQAFTVIYLVLVKWEHRDRPQEFLIFLDELGRQMRLHDIANASTTIPLVWLFIRGVDDHPQRKLQALELLKVLHVLQLELKERLLKFMLRLLLFDPSSSDAQFSFEDLDTLDRAVALTFPLGDWTALTRERTALGE